MARARQGGGLAAGRVGVGCLVEALSCDTEALAAKDGSVENGVAGTAITVPRPVVGLKSASQGPPEEPSFIRHRNSIVRIRGLGVVAGVTQRRRLLPSNGGRAG